jgi:hypothetical protein
MDDVHEVMGIAIDLQLQETDSNEGSAKSSTESLIQHSNVHQAQSQQSPEQEKTQSQANSEQHNSLSQPSPEKVNTQSQKKKKARSANTSIK